MTTDIDLNKLFGGAPGAQPTTQSTPNQTPATNPTTQPSLGNIVAGNIPQVQQKPIDPNAKKEEPTAQPQVASTGNVEGETSGEKIDPMEKQFNELNEILDVNLTDQIEKDVFDETVKQGPVPEGHEVMKQTIDAEQAAEKPAGSENPVPVSDGSVPPQGIPIAPVQPPVVPSVPINPPPVVPGV